MTSAPTPNKQDALQEIVDLAKHHRLTTAEIMNALQDTTDQHAEKSNSIISRVFGYIGGIFIFAGLCVFAGMIWDDVGSAGRIILTLGVGFCSFIAGIVALSDPKLTRAATPLFLTAALLQSGGILVAIDEFSSGGEPLHAILFMTLVMSVQQGLVFISKRRTVLAFTSIFFISGFFATAFDLMNISEDISAMMIGFFLMSMAWSLGKSPHHSIAPVNWFFGSIFLLCGFGMWVEGSALDILFFGLSCALLFLSTLARSRALLFNATIAMLAYIGYFSDKHFGDTLGWPVIMIIMGFCFLGIGALAVRLNNKFIKGQS